MPSHLDSRQLSDRLKQIRIALYGKSGVARLASDLGIPEQTWANYEFGVTMPAELLLSGSASAYVLNRSCKRRAR